MVEPKISLSLLVPGAKRLSLQECKENPKTSYDEHKVTFTYTKGKGKNQKTVKTTLTIHTRKSKLVTQNINLSVEAYESMLDTPTSAKLAKILKSKGDKVIRVWDTMSIDSRLKKHFDLIAHDLGAVSYTYKVFED